MISFIQVIDVLRTFSQGHLQLQKFDFEFREQMPNFATIDEAFPILYVVPVGTVNVQFGKEFELDIYCVDRYKKDRSNVGYVISDTELILSDLSVYLENQIAFDSSYGNTTPINNDLLDYAGGHVMRLRVTVEKQALCEIPFDGVQPTPPTCPSALVRNSDGSWSEIVPSGATYVLPDTPVIVRNVSGDDVGSGDVPSVTGGVITVPDCAPSGDGTAVLKDTDGNILSTTQVAPETTIDIPAPDGTVNVNKSDSTLISAVTVASGGVAPFNVADSTAVLKDSLGTVISTTPIKATESEDITAPDGTVENSDASYTDTVASGGTLVLPDTTINITDKDNVIIDTITFPVYTPVNIDIDSYIPPCADATYDLEDTAGAPLASGNIPSGGSDTIVAPDATIENSNASYSVTEVSGGTLVLPDSDIDVNGVNEGAIPSANTVDIQVTDGSNPVTPNDVTVVGNTVTIEVPADGAAPVGATLMRTGQTTSYRTGDDADTIAEGRATDFFTLASNNPFGNLDRFTDELGGQTYTNDIVIDWSTYDGTTVLGWYRVRNAVNINWNDAIDEALTLSIGGFTSGWRLPNVNEGLSIINFGITSSLNYPPFNNNLGTGRNFTSTTNTNNTTQAFSITASSGIGVASKTTVGTGWRYIPCRTFTVTGTTLT